MDGNYPIKSIRVTEDRKIEITYGDERREPPKPMEKMGFLTRGLEQRKD